MIFNPQPKPKVTLLVGKAKQELRRKCCERAHSRCEQCGRYVPLSSNSGDPLFTNGHMAHIIPRKRGGDIISNVSWKCYYCHLGLEHTKGEK